MGTSQIEKISFVAWLLSDWCLRSFQYPYKPITFHFFLVVDSSNWIISPNIRVKIPKIMEVPPRKRACWILPSCWIFMWASRCRCFNLTHRWSMVENHGRFARIWRFKDSLNSFFSGVLLEKKGSFLTSFGPGPNKNGSETGEFYIKLRLEKPSLWQFFSGTSSKNSPGIWGAGMFCFGKTAWPRYLITTKGRFM